MRLLLVGAFPYPLAQGSQVYLQEQARALRAAGDEPTILTWGRRDEIPTPIADLAEIEQRSVPQWARPRRLRSGPGWSRPVSDLGLFMTLRHEIASKTRENSYDAILTHNAEACVISLRLRQGTGRGRTPPVIYCAHTLMGQELSTYLNSSFEKGIRSISSARTRRRRLGDRLGRSVDRWIARRADGWIALTHSAERVMRSGSIAPGAVVPPPLTDPLGDPLLVGGQGLDIEAVLERLGLEARSYFLYAGNLDGYQELGLLAATAARLAAEGAGERIIVATHDPRADRLAALGTGLEVHRIESPGDLQALLVGARASLLARRAEGGFPIKLVNSLAAGTAPIAFHAREWGLEHGRNAWIASPADPVGSLCEAIRTIAREDALVDRLGHGARALYWAEHRPEVAAARTRALIERVLEARR